MKSWKSNLYFKCLLLIALTIAVLATVDGTTRKKTKPYVLDGVHKQELQKLIHQKVQNSTTSRKSKPMPPFVITAPDAIRDQIKIKRQDDCSGYFDELTGSFGSPGYPSDYPNNAVCNWEIEAPSDYRIRLTFPDFRMEPSSNCEKDFVEVYDGKDFRQ